MPITQGPPCVLRERSASSSWSSMISFAVSNASVSTGFSSIDSVLSALRAGLLKVLRKNGLNTNIFTNNLAFKCSKNAPITGSAMVNSSLPLALPASEKSFSSRADSLFSQYSSRVVSSSVAGNSFAPCA